MIDPLYHLKVYCQIQYMPGEYRDLNPFFPDDWPAESPAGFPVPVNIRCGDTLLFSAAASSAQAMEVCGKPYANKTANTVKILTILTILLL